MRIGICDFNSVPGLVCDRPRGISFARSGASRRSIVAALIRTSRAAWASVSSNSLSRRSIGTNTPSIGASRFPAGARNTAQHFTSAAVIAGPYVGARPRRGVTIFNLNASRKAARA